MRILPDGKVEIVNKRTGQTKVVKPDDLASYSPALLKDYNAYREEQKTLESGGKKTAEQLKQQTAKEKANTIITQLENLYFKRRQ